MINRAGWNSVRLRELSDLYPIISSYQTIIPPSMSGVVLTTGRFDTPKLVMRQALTSVISHAEW